MRPQTETSRGAEVRLVINGGGVHGFPIAQFAASAEGDDAGADAAEGGAI